ncbi:MAG TPA: hypothetical protein VFI31_12305 [Pirellulales bacterium]|nr:hypothetical protein [Pirellulales bacterium]
MAGATLAVLVYHPSNTLPASDAPVAEFRGIAAASLSAKIRHLLRLCPSHRYSLDILDVR